MLLEHFQSVIVKQKYLHFLNMFVSLFCTFFLTLNEFAILPTCMFLNLKFMSQDFIILKLHVTETD